MTVPPRLWQLDEDQAQQGVPDELAKAACRHPSQDHLGDLPTGTGQFGVLGGLGGPGVEIGRAAGRPVLGHLPQQRPRLGKPLISCPP
ncbi:hypothetical protein [Streptomyces sp. NPDC054834]